MTELAVPPVTGPVAPDTVAGHVIVCGLRGIGLRIVEQLHRSGERVVVLAEYADRTQLEVVAAWGVGIVVSQGNSAATLTAAGISAARAVVCVVESEIANLEISLVARELRDDVRVVAQLSNQAIGRAVAGGNGPGAVLDVADLAVPGIVEACLRRRIHAMEIGDETFLLARLPVDRPSTLRGLFGPLAPIAVLRPAAGHLAATVVDCPGRDFPVRPGDVAAMLGTAEDFAHQNVDLEHDAVDAVRVRPGRLRRGLTAIVGVLRDFDRGLYKAVAVLAGLVVLSSLVLSVGYASPKMSWLDAWYFSTETVATVGYGDFSFVDQAPWLRIWAIFLMCAGITCTAVLMAFLTDMLVSRRLGDSIGRRRARNLSGHVVVVGLGTFGIRVAAALVASGRAVVVVERDSGNRFLADARELGVPVIFGDSTLRSTLDAARVAESSAVAVMTSNDMVNIETAIAVRDMFSAQWAGTGAVPVVTRVFDRSLGRTVARRFGFENVQSTEELTAPYFVGAALGLEVLGSFPVAQQTFMVSRLTVEPGSSLAGLAMNELSANTRVIALTRADTCRMEHPPRRGTRFKAGDLAYLVGPYEELLGVLHRARLADDPLAVDRPAVPDVTG
ncbi:Trk K+ transport system, NAD-binding component [Nakamurella panacisegetis]|uniref:Trk K+ transport system, NAD-binding component n=1 Tax=Nakamurella panacisegetis TaxID=1090615 RepID=A0A1H0J904_9ACTN|nr:NAD-binding protein [Nakamurella panacisegetis]SDO40217.1 Trk K+ transport system, NAD-binding component [Nakamurella panacisegetis]